MKFAEPLWLIAGLTAVIVLVWRYRQSDRRQHLLLNTFVSPHLVERLTRSVSAGRRKLKRALVVTGVACLFLALARPQAGFRWEETHRNGLDILFAVDTSKSMLTPDVKPDRLTRAKLAVNDLVDRLNGDSVGLIAFAGNAFLMSPVTLDYDAFRETLNALDTSVIPRGGTYIARAIREAQAAFQTENNHDKILVLVTDGEDLEGNAVSAAEAAAKDGVKIFTVGVGTANGDLIPVPAENGGTEYVKDANGQFVKSRLDEPMLKKIAAVTGGMYQPLGQQGEGLTAIYNQGLAPFKRHDLASRQHRVYLERFQWPLLAALLCFMADFLIGTRKRLPRIADTPLSSNAARLAPRKPKLATATAVGALAFMLFSWPNGAQASPQSAEKAYQQGDFATAEKQYQSAAAKTPGKADLEFNLGSAAYKDAAYDQAAQAFQKSLKTDQVKLQQDTYYNFGNTLYREGQQTEKANPQQTIKTWQQAVQSYDAALQIKSADADARYNRDFVKKKLEQLQKQQQQQQKQNNQNKEERKDQNQQANSGPNQKDQKNQPQQNKNQQAQGSNQQQPQNPSSGKDQQAKTGQQPQPGQPQGQDHATAEPKQDGSEEQAEAQPVPGQMTRDEAKALLDSVKSGEHRLPAAPLARNQYQDDNQPPLKDW